MELIHNQNGNYSFLTGIAPYSSGVVADDGHEVIHVTLKQPIPYRKGFDLIDKYLSVRKRSRYALCAMELRSPKPFSFEGFSQFNQGYQDILADWDLMVGDKNPIARTNIAPKVRPPDEPMLYAFSYTLPLARVLDFPTFVVAGAGELSGANLSPDDIVRAGETDTDAMQEKAAHVLGIMQARLLGLKMTWQHVTAVDVYTVNSLKPILADTISSAIEQAVAHGIRWHYGRPPIEGLEFEMDMRGVAQDLWI